MVFKRLSALALCLVLGSVSAAPLEAVAPKFSANYLAGLKTFLEETNPDDLILNIPGNNSTTAHDLFDPEWRAAHGLPDPRTSTNEASPEAMFLHKRYICAQGDEGAFLRPSYCLHDSLIAQTCSLTINPNANVNVAECTIGGNRRALLTARLAYGYNYASTSACSDYARGMEALFNNCHTSCNNVDTCTVGGLSYVYGNGNIAIFLQK